MPGGVVFRQRLHDKVETQPQAPTVMIESDWKHQRHDKKQSQHAFVTRSHNQQEKEANDENDELRGDDVCEDSAHEKPVFTLEKRQAVGAVMPDVKRVRDDGRFATCGAAQSQRSTQNRFDLAKIFFHPAP